MLLKPAFELGKYRDFSNNHSLHLNSPNINCECFAVYVDFKNAIKNTVFLLSCPNELHIKTKKS